MFDRTQRILIELENMINKGELSSTPQLEKEIKELIKKVNINEINLIEYRKANSKDRFGSDIVEAIATANNRQQKSQ